MESTSDEHEYHESAVGITTTPPALRHNVQEFSIHRLDLHKVQQQLKYRTGLPEMEIIEIIMRGINNRKNVNAFKKRHCQISSTMVESDVEESVSEDTDRIYGFELCSKSGSAGSLFISTERN